ncbi:MAG: thioredoxin family protein [Bacteroidia bacterium]|nr:thioredoxin family protein [Bacteroidia bacterium]
MKFDYNEEVMQRSNNIPILVEFSAPSCGPCQWMEKLLVELTKENSGRFEFVSLPVTEVPQIVNELDIKSNPTTILFSHGKEIARLSGALPKIAIEQWLNDHLS